MHNSTSHAGQQAGPAPGVILPLRSFWVEIDAEGQPFTWQGDAINEPAAFKCALHDLERFYPTINREAARMVVCIERGTEDPDPVLSDDLCDAYQVPRGSRRSDVR